MSAYACTDAMSIALVTPTFYLDYEPCRILIDSVARYIPSNIQHYLIVSRDDLALFRPFANQRTHVLVQEDVVEEHFWRVPLVRRLRFNWRTLPVRGWIWQQMVKLSISAIDADSYMLADSDTFFVAPFDPASLVTSGGGVPFYREEKDWYETNADTQEWAKVSRRMLRLPRATRRQRVGYVNTWGFWRRDVLRKLHAHVSNGRGASAWLRAVARNVNFSEYFLYGIFVEEVLGTEASGHYPMGEHLSHDYYPYSPLSTAELAEFARTRGDKAMVMINAKSRTPAEQIRAAFGF
jgi:hypothetical protein